MGSLSKKFARETESELAAANEINLKPANILK